MAQKRTRDAIWTWVLIKTGLQGEHVRPDDVIEQASCSDKTARETLNVMADTPFLERDVMSDGTVRFRRGPAFDE